MPPREGRKLAELVTFGDHIRRLRLSREWTQERLASEAELNSVQVSHIENGLNEVKLRTILKLARAFGITASELMRPFR